MDLNRPKNLLLTGRPGTGKTTAIIKVTGLLPPAGLSAHGFFTEEIRASGKRAGFRIRTLEGKSGILARLGQESRFRVGKYGVSLEDLEKVAVPDILPRGGPGEIIVVDEIGTMELFSEMFAEAVVRALDSPARVIATIKPGGHRLIAKILNRRDVELLELTPENRDGIPGVLVDRIRG